MRREICTVRREVGGRPPSPPRVTATALRRTHQNAGLPADAARAWAARVLDPVLSMPRGGRQLLETAALAVEFEVSVAADVSGVHRNTVARRVRQVFDAVGLDHDRVLDRVVLSLAAQIAGRYGTDRVADPAAMAALLTHVLDARRRLSGDTR